MIKSNYKVKVICNCGHQLEDHWHGIRRTNPIMIKVSGEFKEDHNNTKCEIKACECKQYDECNNKCE